MWAQSEERRRLGDAPRKVDPGDLFAAAPEVMAGQLATLAVD